MKRLLLVCLLLVTNAARGEWVKVGESAGNNYYIDPTSIRKDEDLRKVWMIQDLKERDKAGEMSRRYREEYDCKGERKRFLSATSHSEPMAGGKTLLSSNEPSSWGDIRANTFGEDILKKVCTH